MAATSIAGREQPTTERLLSLDAYRGLIMIALAFNGFGLAETAKLQLAQDPDSALWKTIQYQFSHVEWVGCAFWDLIQPSFMFMVGASMAYSYVKRSQRGDGWFQMLGHAFVRSVILCLLGIFLISNGAKTTSWSFMNVLTQIGLGYTFLFLMWRRPAWLQLVVVAMLLGATWWLYISEGTSGIDLASGASEVGVSKTWAEKELTNVAPPWHKNANVGHRLDTMILNWIPRADPFLFNNGGYQTINFIPSLATMLLGLMAGEILRGPWSAGKKLSTLLVGGAAGIGIAYVCNLYGCPIIKRIWTPSWAIGSAGVCCLILAVLYGIIDVAGLRRWSLFLVVVGMNSIAIYVMGQLLRGWTARTLQTHFGEDVFLWLGESYRPVVQHTLVGLCFWLVCFWMYRNRIFIRI